MLLTHLHPLARECDHADDPLRTVDFFNANFTETSSDGKYVAYRGELTICEGEVADAQGRRKPPTEVLKWPCWARRQLKFLTGLLDAVAQLPDLIARFGADITADTIAVLFVDRRHQRNDRGSQRRQDVSDPMSEGMAWNELIDVLALEKATSRPIRRRQSGHPVQGRV